MMLLKELKEHGVCGMLNLTNGECYINIYNATTLKKPVWKKYLIRQKNCSNPCNWVTGLIMGLWVSGCSPY